MKNLEVTIEPLGLSDSGDVKMLFKITNSGDSDLSVYKWATPLEGLKSDCLIVTVNGIRVDYDGKMVKRRLSPNSFISLKPGETKSSVFELNDAYPIPSGTNDVITVQLDISKLSPPDSDQNDLIPYIENFVDDIAVNTRPATLRITSGTNVRPTLGARVRQEEKKSPDNNIVEYFTGPKAPDVRSEDAERKAVILRAHRNGYALAKHAVKILADIPLYKRWFGKFDQKRSEKVRSSYQKIVTRMESATFIYLADNKGCDEDDYAYTFLGSLRIHLCSAFWEAHDEGSESRAGTIVHEHSHASARTDDHKYGKADCLDLARNNPTFAIRNADSYEYFAEAIQDI